MTKYLLMFFYKGESDDLDQRENHRREMVRQRIAEMKDSEQLAAMRAEQEQIDAYEEKRRGNLQDQTNGGDTNPHIGNEDVPPTDNVTFPIPLTERALRPFQTPSQPKQVPLYVQSSGSADF